MEQKKISILLADDNVEFCRTVVSYFKMQEDMHIIETVHDGMEAYRSIKLRKPDVAILDGVLPSLDGIGVIEKLGTKETRPVCLIISNLRNDNIVKYAYSLGVEYYLMKPFEMDTLAQRIRILFGNRSPRAEKETSQSEVRTPFKSLESRISDILCEVGIPTYIRGYVYTHTAILMTVYNPELLYHVTKELYPAVADMCNASAGGVERAIRTVIERAYINEKKNPNTSAFLSGLLHNVNGRPTNVEFISFIAERLRMDIL